MCFRSCGSRAQLPCVSWNLPGLGVRPMPPLLAGGFLATGPTTSEVLKTSLLYHNNKLKEKVTLKLPLFWFMTDLLQSIPMKWLHRNSLRGTVHFSIRIACLPPLFQKFFKSASSLETQKATSWNCNPNQSAKILYSHRQTILSLPHWASLGGSLAWYRNQGLHSPPCVWSWICHLLVTWPWTNYLNLLYFTSVFGSFSYLLCNSNIILKLGNSKQQTLILSQFLWARHLEVG